MWHLNFISGVWEMMFFLNHIDFTCSQWVFIKQFDISCIWEFGNAQEMKFVKESWKADC